MGIRNFSKLVLPAVEREEMVLKTIFTVWDFDIKNAILFTLRGKSEGHLNGVHLTIFPFPLTLMNENWVFKIRPTSKNRLKVEEDHH